LAVSGSSVYPSSRYSSSACSASCARLDEIELVDHDQRSDALLRGCGEAAIEQLLVERWDRREHDHHLRDVRGDQLLAMAFAAIEQGAARVDRFDHTLVGGSARRPGLDRRMQAGCACRAESTSAFRRLRFRLCSDGRGPSRFDHGEEGSSLGFYAIDRRFLKIEAGKLFATLHANARGLKR
jgi:hypothetical protein